MSEAAMIETSSAGRCPNYEEHGALSVIDEGLYCQECEALWTTSEDVERRRAQRRALGAGRDKPAVLELREQTPEAGALGPTVDEGEISAPAVPTTAEVEAATAGIGPIGPAAPEPIASEPAGVAADRENEKHLARERVDTDPLGTLGQEPDREYFPVEELLASLLDQLPAVRMIVPGSLFAERLETRQLSPRQMTDAHRVYYERIRAGDKPEAVWQALDDIVRGTEPYFGPKDGAVSQAEQMLEDPRAAEILAECHGPAWTKAAHEFLHAPQHGTAADLFFHAMRSSVIAERITLNESNRFFRRGAGTCYSMPFSTIRLVSRLVLEKAVDDALDAEKPLTQGQDIKDLYALAGKATAKARTRDFIAGALAFFSDMVLVEPSIPWNATREAIPTLTDVLDFSGPELVARPARKDEYFRDPAPCTAREILEAKDTPRFREFIAALFADELTRRSAIECAATCITGVPRKLFYVWNNREGDGGKNTLFDFLSRLVPERIVMAKNALILYRGESGERRFGESIMRGRSGIGFDEPSGAFDVPQIKRYAGLSGIRVEDKGEKSIVIEPTWVMVALCNALPRFYPDDDWAFLSRVFVLPFSSVFWKDADDYKVRLSQGIAPARLKQARDKDVLLAELLEERPAILALLARIWITMRANGGNPFESAECRKAKEAYRSSNDAAERFFNEYLQRDDSATVEYFKVKAAWSEFTGEAKPAMRDVVACMTRRFPFITTTRSHGLRKLSGVTFKEDKEPEPPDDKTGASGAPFLDFLPRERDKANSISGVENGVFRHPEHPSIPADLSPLPTQDVERLFHWQTEWMDGDPPHPEGKRDLDRIMAELSARDGGSP